MEFMDVVRCRRTVRSFRTEAIPEAVLDDILQAGYLAAAGHHARNWQFGVIKDEKIKQELVKAAGDQDWLTTAPVILAMCVKLVKDLKEYSEDDLVLKVNHCRFGKELIDYLNKFPDRRAVKILTQNGDVFIPGQQMFLAAANHGLSACWIGYLDIEKAGEILQLPNNIACLFLLPVGYPDGEPDEVERKDFSQMVFYDQWGG